MSSFKRTMLKQSAQTQTNGDGKLLPCPFCGKDPEIRITDDIVAEYYVFCVGCGITQGCLHTRKRAVQNWNRRAPQEEKP